MQKDKSFTDHILQRFRLYIEGVEVPFVSISITSGLGGLPTANITIPAQSGLMDIARFYSPKVHVFYSDRLIDYDENNTEQVKQQDKLLFSGLISQVAYQKTKDVSSSINISFSCVHRYSLINEMLIDYSGWLGGDVLDKNQNESAVKADTANSKSSVITALAGITRKHKSDGTSDEQEITLDNPGGKVTTMPKAYNIYYNRLQGMPSVMINFWNQMKRSAFNKSLSQGKVYYSESFIKMYKPLIEKGLHFFERLGGHSPIEGLIADDLNRVDPCPETPASRESILIPPMYQMFLSSSVSAQMSISNISSYLQYSGETTTIYGIFNSFYSSIDYDILTLNSPAEVPIRPDLEVSALVESQAAAITGVKSPLNSETYALDTIVKPRLPFYFSPTCNVLFPSMYTSISVMYDEMNIPTRVNAKSVEGVSDSSPFRTNFRSPPSIREAIAAKVGGVNGGTGFVEGMKYSLLSTTGSSAGAIGVYEQGRGIKLENMQMPRWLSMFSQTTFGANTPVTDASPTPAEQNRKDAQARLATGWSLRYPGSATQTLNPYSVENSDVSTHHRILFTSADYYYTQVFARSKAGRVECPFNPYIVPGYPMDILEANPMHPSFHAMCIGITHNITATSVGTSVDFTAAMTYSELNNYYIPFVNPMLAVSLGLAENPTLIGQIPGGEALLAADDFYKYTLGCPGIAPDELVDFKTMGLKPKKWQGGKWVNGSDSSIRGSNGGEMNPMLSYEGMLSMVQRPIENKAKIETRFGIKFVDMAMDNYNSSVIRYKNPELDMASKYEIGRSQFLTYKTFFGEKIIKQDVTGTSTVSSDTSAVTVTTDINGNTTSVRKGQ